MTVPNREELAQTWAGSICTLDGKDAIVQGRLNDFATVRQVKGKAEADFSWFTVDRVMVFSKGAFSTRTVSAGRRRTWMPRVGCAT